MNAHRLTLVCSILLAAAGFIFQFWPLFMVSIVCAALTNHVLTALALGLISDLLFGTPLGVFQYLFFPFTILALCSIVGYVGARRYFFSNDPLNL